MMTSIYLFISAYQFVKRASREDFNLAQLFLNSFALVMENDWNQILVAIWGSQIWSPHKMSKFSMAGVGANLKQPNLKSTQNLQLPPWEGSIL